MKHLLVFGSLFLLAVGCSSSSKENYDDRVSDAKEEYEESVSEAKEEYDDEVKQAQEEYQGDSKDEAIDMVEDSDGVQVNEEEGQIKVED